MVEIFEDVKLLAQDRILERTVEIVDVLVPHIQDQIVKGRW